MKNLFNDKDEATYSHFIIIKNIARQHIKDMKKERPFTFRFNEQRNNNPKRITPIAYPLISEEEV